MKKYGVGGGAVSGSGKGKEHEVLGGGKREGRVLDLAR